MANCVLELKRLEALRGEFGPPAAERKQACLQALKAASFGTAGQLLRLHEILCFMQAWPDDDAILSLVDVMLARFGHARCRGGMRRSWPTRASPALPSTSDFLPSTARWLADRWPDQIRIDWETSMTPEATWSPI